jgi:membrane-bound serine protease (ClpP class)
MRLSIASFSKLIVIVTTLCALLPALRIWAQASSQPLVYRLEIRDTIQPITAGRLDRALQQANQDHAAALLIELDTPGGLLDSTRQMVGAILSSPVPVIVYIAPAGARAGSAGFFLLEAADIAAMAPGTNAGAAHPVLASGTPDDTMKQKIENDTAAFLRSFIGRHGRNAQVAEEAVRNSKSFSADEALNLQGEHLIDLTAANDQQLLSALDGRTVTRDDGSGQKSSFIFHLQNAQIVTLQPTVREQVLGALANPNLALLLLVGGALLIYLEFNAPGTIVPGALGTVMVLLAVFSLDLLPIRHTAILLLLAAAVLMVLEIKFTSHGALGIAGIVCLAIGTLTLVDAPIPEMGIHPLIALALSTGFGILTIALLRLALRARRTKFLIGPAALVGFPATAMEDLRPATQAATQGIGRILVQGEIWQATCTEPVPEKTSLRVTGFQGDILEVQPVAQAPASSSS